VACHQWLLKSILVFSHLFIINFAFESTAPEHRQPRIFWETRVGPRAAAQEEYGTALRDDSLHVAALNTQTCAFRLVGPIVVVFHPASITPLPERVTQGNLFNANPKTPVSDIVATAVAMIQ